ncbi:MAG: hypothetical protein ACM3JD_20075 [Rudaea sp.]
MPDPSPKPTDSRAFGRQLERELIIGGILVGLVVGVGLILVFWGPAAAVTALACFGLFGLVILLVWLLLLLLSWLGGRES